MTHPCSPVPSVTVSSCKTLANRVLSLLQVLNPYHYQQHASTNALQIMARKVQYKPKHTLHRHNLAPSGIRTCYHSAPSIQERERINSDEYNRKRCRSSDSLLAAGFGVRTPVGVRDFLFNTPVQIDLEAHTASCTNGFFSRD